MRRWPRLVYALVMAERATSRWIAARGRGSGIRAASAGVLFFLATTEEASVKDVSRALGASAAGTTGLLNRLSSSGLIIRKADEADSRVVRVSLTDAGRNVLPAVSAALAELNAELTEGFTSDELEVVSRWLLHAASLAPPGSAGAQITLRGRRI